MKQVKKYFPLVLRLIAAVILLQTLTFKFSAHPDSVYIFSTVGLEPFGRIGIGILELIAAGLLLFRRTAWAGGILGWGLMNGAIFFHLTNLGIVVNGDGGLLFALAVTVWVSCLAIIFIYRKEIPIVGKYFLGLSKSNSLA